MMAKRTLHFVSSASSTMAGRSDWDNCWIPITSLTQSRLEMMFSLTSGHSSFSWAKNNGSRCSIVLECGEKEVVTLRHICLLLLNEAEKCPKRAFFR